VGEHTVVISNISKFRRLLSCVFYEDLTCHQRYVYNQTPLNKVGGKITRLKPACIFRGNPYTFVWIYRMYRPLLKPDQKGVCSFLLLSDFATKFTLLNRSIIPSLIITWLTFDEVINII
jgi:hypothetical protein